MRPLTNATIEIAVAISGICIVSALNSFRDDSGCLTKAWSSPTRHKTEHIPIKDLISAQVEISWVLRYFVAIMSLSSSAPRPHKYTPMGRICDFLLI